MLETGNLTKRALYTVCTVRSVKYRIKAGKVNEIEFFKAPRVENEDRESTNCIVMMLCYRVNTRNTRKRKYSEHYKPKNDRKNTALHIE
jgi:hypothetical protein